MEKQADAWLCRNVNFHAASAGPSDDSTVGPDAIDSNGSPITSEMIRQISVPAPQARARPPPLI